MRALALSYLCPLHFSTRWYSLLCIVPLAYRKTLDARTGNNVAVKLLRGGLESADKAGVALKQTRLFTEINHPNVSCWKYGVACVLMPYPVQDPR